MTREEATPAPLHEQLTAYLDGELDEASSREVERAIAADAAVQDELREYEAVWSLLDELPRSEADESFTRTTVEMLAVKASRELAQRRRTARPLWWARQMAACLALALAGFLGVVIVDAALPRPDDAVLRELTLIENLDVYRQVHDIEFLRKLQKETWLKNEQQP